MKMCCRHRSYMATPARLDLGKGWEFLVSQPPHLGSDRSEDAVQMAFYNSLSQPGQRGDLELFQFFRITHRKYCSLGGLHSVAARSYGTGTAVL
jgi:hypothetical protein